MQMLNKLALASLAVVAAAQRPSNESICDYYTTALLKENNATNQLTLLTLVVNTAVIGNYTQPNVGIAVSGILNPNATFNGTKVNLVPYFSGALASSNRGGSSGVSVNFLDGGAATPLLANMPANNTSSNQYRLLTHLYSYFGDLLGCSQVGQTGYPAYAGTTSMYTVHKFMALDPYEVGYFIEQVGLSAASFGVAQSDVAIVGGALTEFFDYRCSAPVSILPSEQPELQAICIDSSCPIAPNATCSSYAAVVTPSLANGTTPSSTGVPTSTSTTSPTVSPFKGDASIVGAALGPAALAFGILGFML